MADKSHGRLDVLVLGRSPEVTTGWPHRVTISVCPRGEMTLLNFSVGPQIVNTGRQAPVTQVILDGEVNETYAEEFDACEARWFVPQRAQPATKERMTDRANLKTYQSRFGHPPKTERSADHTF